MPEPDLETEGDHAGAAADAAFLDRSAGRAIERRGNMFEPEMVAVDVVQETVIGFGRHRQAPAAVERGRQHALHPAQRCVA